MATPEAQEFRAVALGLTDTGKSSYLGALFIAVESQSVDTKLRLGDYSENRKYANQLADPLRQCKEIGRTNIGEEGDLTLRLVDDLGRELSLVIPDLSGETLRRALETRRLPMKVAEDLKTCSGLLLFVHPDVTYELPEIDSASVEGVIEFLEQREKGPGGGSAESVAAKGGPDPERDTVGGESESESSGQKPKATWSNDHASSEVKMVDALQETLRLVTPPLRVGVIVSAWDVARETCQTPEAWLAKRMPLLDQFLEANQGRSLISRIYGVAAQGSNYESVDEEFLRIEAAKRVSVVGPDASPHDLTAPIAWLRGD